MAAGEFTESFTDLLVIRAAGQAEH